MRRAYKFRLRPTARQHVALQQCLDDHRALYNAALEERRGRWAWNRRSVGYGDQSAQLSHIRAADAHQARWSFSSQQATLRRLNRTFAAFFRRVRAGATVGYPRFRSAHRFDSVEWPKDGDGCRWKPDASQVYLQGVGDVKATVHRPVEGRVKTITAKREGRRWYVIVSRDDIPARPAAPTGRAVGIDLGVAVFAATSEGALIANPRHGRVAAGRLAAAQQVLAGKQRGSNNRRRARQVVANRHRKIANQRRDFHHQTARGLIDTFDLLVVEDLTVTNMCRSAAGTSEAPGTNVAAKSGLNRSILDAGWAQFASILAGKAEEAGRQLIKVNPRHTSQTCSQCGHVAAANRVSRAEFRCQACQHSAHADINAARNILRAGLALQTQAA